MKSSRLLLVVLAVSAMSFAKQDRENFRPRSCYPAGSLIEDDKALGGFGGCNNYPRELGDKDWGTKGTVALVAFPEEEIAYFKEKGFVLRLVNRSDRIMAFAAFDSCIYILQEAVDENGRWREIESPPDSDAFCGNSFHRVLIKPGEYWQFPARRYEGKLKTKIRFRLDPTSEPGEEPPIYSNEFEGFVDPSQLRIGPDRAKLRKAVRSARATPDVIATLIDGLTDDNERTRWLSASRLGGFGPAAKDSIPALQNAIKGSDATLRVEAAASLFAIDDQPKLAIDTLAATLGYRDANARARAISHLCELGPAAKDAVPALCLALRKESEHHLRANIAETLGKIRSQSDICVPALVKALRDPEWFVRSYASQALGEFGAEAQQAIPQLTETIRDPDGFVKVSSAQALWQIHGKAEPTVSVLISTLVRRENENYIPDAAADALGAMGPIAKDAAPALNKLLADKKEWRGARICAAAALWRITRDAKPTLELFISELQNPALNDDSDTSRILNTLEEMGPNAKEAVPVLTGLLNRDSPTLREAAAKLLKKIGQ